jgi:nitrite reductase/ring-hydroxylating ferredoxin subunit
VEVPEVTAIRPNSSTIHHAWLLTIDEFERTRARMEKVGYDVSDSRAQFRAMGENSMDIYDPDGHRYQIQAYAPEATAVITENTGPITCGHVDDFPVGSVKTFVKGKFFLVRLEGGFLALSRWCTHLNGLLGWKKEHWEFYCPMHGARFDRRGMARPLARPCPPLRRHPVTITRSGEVVVEPDTVIPREGFDGCQLTAPAPAAEAARAGEGA